MTKEDANDAAATSSTTTTTTTTKNEKKDDDVVLERLSEGFRSLRVRNEDPALAERQERERERAVIHRHVVVNFVDPTSATSSMSSLSAVSTAASSSASSAPKSPGGHSLPHLPPLPAALHKQKKKPPLELYENLIKVFERHYQSTLRYVQYQQSRSGAKGVIEHLPVRPVRTLMSHGGSVAAAAAAQMNNDEDDGPLDAPWGGAAGMVTDVNNNNPSEWHCGPYCHVYIAACESIEHYRQKIRPALQAFVSQIEAAAAAAAAASSSSAAAAANGGADSSRVSSSGTSSVSSSPKKPGSSHGDSPHGARYVIVYVPVGDRKRRAAGAGSGNDDERVVGRRVVSLAKRIKKRYDENRSGTEYSGDSTHSNNTQNTEGSGEDNSSVGATSVASTDSVTKLTKTEKEIVRRFTADFAHAHVCTLSTLVVEADGDGKDGKNSMGEGMSELQKLEWNSFMKALGAAIVDGFRDRCRRYDDELRRLDALRAPPPTSTGRRWSGKKDTPTTPFNLGHFFLVKESLAFTYEQMHLPMEALLQYEELRAFLPDLDVADLALKDGEGIDNDTALAGDTVAVRRLIRSMTSLEPISHVVEQYVFARDISLLFQCNRPVEAVERCLFFVQTMHALKQELAPAAAVDVEAMKKMEIDAELWAIHFCWDVKKASQCYFTIKPADADMEDYSGVERDDARLARSLCKLIDFARQRLLVVDTLSSTSGSIRHGCSELIADDQEWPTWEPSATSSADSDGTKSEDVGNENGEDDDFVGCAMSSPEEFQTQYLLVSRVLVSLNRSAGRHRFAAQHRMDIMDMCIRRGEKRETARALRWIASVYANDGWVACHFLLLFRIAALQRQLAEPREYMKTLVSAFCKKNSQVVPDRALALLHKDLEQLVRHPIEPRARFSEAPMFAPVLNLAGISPGSSIGSKRGMIQKLVSVGEKVVVALSLTSYLPRDVKVDNITVSVVPYHAYIASVEDSVRIEADDVHHVLSTKSSTLRPGLNQFNLDWVPMESGQFVVTSVEIHWKKVRFFYGEKHVRRQTIRLDIVPSDPTQTLDVDPAFLLPGHEQPLRIRFGAGTDIVKEGLLKLVCSPGLLLLPPGSGKDSGGEWVSSCDAPLPPCSPGETVDVVATVKSVGSEDSTSHDTDAPTLHAKLSTSYFVNGSDKSSKSTSEDFASCDSMNTVLEAVVPTLAKPALVVEDIAVIPYTVNRIMVTVTITCNTPVAIIIRGWRLDTPQNLALAEDGDKNGSVLDSKVGTDECVFFGFECICGDESEASSSSPTGPMLHIDFEDSYGTKFSEPLKLKMRPTTIRRKHLPVKEVSVKLDASVVEGAVGCPVKLGYTIDSGALTNITSKVFYKVDSFVNEWILSGKVEGVIEQKDPSSNARLDVLAIPAGPGTIDRYPELSLFYEDEKGDNSTMVPLPVNLDSATQQSFRAFLPPNYYSVAFPTTTINKPRTDGHRRRDSSSVASGGTPDRLQLRASAQSFG